MKPFEPDMIKCMPDSLRVDPVGVTSKASVICASRRKDGALRRQLGSLHQG
ncbi:hypothetical protein A2U01_0106483, partial [Trifolium medium]|nr:hypothetical protein [Trifolium medium]